MIKKRFSAAVILLPLLLAACNVDPMPSKSASVEVSKLKSMGYQVTARSSDGDTTVLRYSGPINASVKCGEKSGQLRARQGFKLNSYLILSSGSAAKRDGLYVISKTTRSSVRGAVKKVETIAFEPGKRGTFPSGLTCQAT